MQKDTTAKNESMKQINNEISDLLNEDKIMYRAILWTLEAFRAEKQSEFAFLAPNQVEVSRQL
jgi:hypothetical protein